ncbi:hypothetical protein NE865_02547 [Phthorimaea operculella]|nr:hypothetical protein NE865_02547 [Phthorimaea operculella]
MDTSAGMMRGRPYGGVALLWKKSVFADVSVVPSDNPRVCAVRINTSDRPLLILSVYMPTDDVSNSTEFSHCLGFIDAIIEASDAEAVYCMGDFNSHPHEPFYNDLMRYCDENDLVCADVHNLRLDSDTYTYVSDINGARRWLDHIICSESAMRTVRNVSVKYDVLWSDHYPMLIECNLDIIRPKLSSRVSSDNKVLWGQRCPKTIATYSALCHSRLREIDFPETLSKCCDRMCSDLCHKPVLDGLYRDIVTALKEAAVESAGKNRGKLGKRPKHVLGWNRHVSEAHRCVCGESNFRTSFNGKSCPQPSPAAAVAASQVLVLNF